MFEVSITNGTDGNRTAHAVRTTRHPIAMGGRRVVRAGHDAADAAAVFFRDPHEQRGWQHHGFVAVSVRNSQRNALCEIRQ